MRVKLKRMYKLGLSYNIFAANERGYVQLSGLEESLEDGIQLLNTYYLMLFLVNYHMII